MNLDYCIYIFKLFQISRDRMARIAAPPPKFTIPEWTISNQIKYGNAEAERAAAERLVEESKRVDEETRKTTFKTQRDVNKKIGEFA